MDQLRPSGINVPPNTPPPVDTVSMPAEDQPIQNSTTREFDIENIKPESKLFTVDLMGEDADVNFAKVKTPDARPDVNNQNTSYINPAPSGPNNLGSSPMGTPLIKSRDELRSGVKAAIMVVDYVISLIAMKIAGSNDQRTHTADTSQKKLLEDVIVEYLFGKQKQMPLWLTLVFAIAGSYGLIIFAAIRQRSQITKNKKLIQNTKSSNDGYKDVSIRNESYVKSEDVKKYETLRPGNNPQEKLTLNKIYSDKNKDGVMEPVNNPSFSEVINPPQKSSPEYPDKNLVAISTPHVKSLVAKGQYPMYKKTLSGKIIKIRYNEDGLPIMQGKPAKLIKRK